MLVLKSAVNLHGFREEPLNENIKQIIWLEEKIMPCLHTIKEEFLIGVRAHRELKNYFLLF